MKKLIDKLLGKSKFTQQVEKRDTVSEDTDADALWDEVYKAREAFYASHFGVFPENILKSMNLIGIWPGGGLIDMPIDNFGSGLHLYSTFGFSNPGLRNGMQSVNTITESGDGNSISISGEMRRIDPNVEASATGFGYELLVVTKEATIWPQYFLNWIAGLEFNENFELLDRVNEFDGITLERIGISETESMDMIITRAVDPLPAKLKLPTGDIDLLIGTLVTPDELSIARENSASKLLELLLKSNVGQVSDPKRQSVLI